MNGIQVVVLILLSAGVVIAQDENRALPTPPPLSADITIERVTQLIDGNKLKQSTQGHFYRDDQRRTRTEFGPHVTIFDPVAKTTIALDLNQRTALVTDVAGRLPRQSAGSQEGAADSTLFGGLKGQSLGSRIIEGYLASGKEYKSIIPPGSTLGNELPIESTTRFWYSDDLVLPLLTEANGPLVSHTVTKYHNLVVDKHPRDELFSVPSDFNITREVWTPKGLAPRTMTNPNAYGAQP